MRGEFVNDFKDQGNPANYEIIKLVKYKIKHTIQVRIT